MLIQKLRLQRGWSQEQLADVSGLSARTIQRLERGRPASLETRKALAAAFRVELSSLMEDATNMTANDASFAQSPSPSRPAGDLAQDEALAFARVRKIKRFYIHLAQYAIVIPVLCLINALTSPRYFWAIWPALGWGAGLLFHGLRAFDAMPFLGPDWERRQVEKRLGRPL